MLPLDSSAGTATRLPVISMAVRPQHLLAESLKDGLQSGLMESPAPPPATGLCVFLNLDRARLGPISTQHLCTFGHESGFCHPGWPFCREARDLFLFTERSYFYGWTPFFLQTCYPHPADEEHHQSQSAVGRLRLIVWLVSMWSEPSMLAQLL